MSGIGRDNLKMILKAKFEEYTEAEYSALISRLFEGDYSSEREHDAIIENILCTSQHPDGTGVLYDPKEGVEDSPKGVLNTIKEWRTANGKPGFKPE
ncbi:bacteriocin immunity protein [Pseudomonas sp. TH08]|uniref:bacteriocin immunity protein n=1 Tax=Pseudomonas sp. TH08 TaxID=2796374 RepID=UPI001F5C0044|nr:bacteriocin immunity protein [Pseudomonas sp. TH08]